MLSLWVDLPWWIKMPISLAIMGVGGYLLWEARGERDALDFAGNAVQHRNFFFGIVLLPLGLVLLATSGRSKSEKRGYRSI